MNRNSPAIKRILADVREISKHPSSRYHAAPLEDNMFEWHFTIRGSKDTDFEGGLYHGRILLPLEYPFKPPNIIFLNVCNDMSKKYYCVCLMTIKPLLPLFGMFIVEKWKIRSGN